MRDWTKFILFISLTWVPFQVIADSTYNELKYAWALSDDGESVICVKHSIEKVGQESKPRERRVAERLCYVDSNAKVYVEKIKGTEMCVLFTMGNNKEKIFLNIEEGDYCEKKEEENIYANQDHYMAGLQRELQQDCALLGTCEHTLTLDQKDNLNKLTKVLLATLKENLKMAKEEHHVLANQIETVRAQITECIHNQTNPKLYLAVTALEKQLRKRIKTLENDTSTFHWLNGYQLLYLTDTPPLKSDRANWYARYMRGLFWDEDDMKESNHVGRGLYTARDPVVTKHFGDTLLKIDIPKGSTYIDLSDLSEEGSLLTMDVETHQAFKEAGCEPEGYTNKKGFEALFRKEDLSHTEACRKIFNQTIENLGINFLAYNYENRKDYKYNNPDMCNHHRDVAFVLFNVDLNKKNVSVFKKSDAKYPGDKEKQEAYRAINAITDEPMNPNFKPDEKTKEQWKKRLFECE